MDSNEIIIFNNSFGTVSDKRVIINFKDGSVDVPIKQITSISFKRKQNIPLAIIYFIVSASTFVFVFNLNQVPGYMIIIALIIFLLFLFIGIAFYIGNHQIKLSTAGKDRKPIKIEMSKTKEGRAFYDAIKRQIISI